MTGSPSQKVARLAMHLIRQPRYLIPYIKTNVLGRASALELELPWIAYAAIDFLNGFAKPAMSVFEYGSGGSTLFFARRCASVVSVENNRIWLDKVQQRITEAKLNNVILHHRPFDFKLGADFENSEYLQSMPAQKFDIVLIDSSEGSVQLRPHCFYHAESFAREGGIIVVDDSWRYLELRRKNNARQYKIFQSVGPSRPGVTSTDIFFY
jgi:predicted O-methyltransferase YrrM